MRVVARGNMDVRSEAVDDDDDVPGHAPDGKEHRGLMALVPTPQTQNRVWLRLVVVRRGIVT